MSKPITHHVPLRSSMALLSNICKQSAPYGLRDILREKRILTKTEATARKFRANLISRETRVTVNQRVGFTRRFGSKKKNNISYGIVGLGKLETSDFGQVKSSAKSAGYTHLKFGGKLITL